MKMKNLSAAAAALVLSLAAGAAHADRITFDGLPAWDLAPFAPLLTHLDEFSEGAYWLSPFSAQAGAMAGMDLVGALVDGAHLADTCMGVACPGGNASTFFAGLNDGVLALGRQDGGLFTLSSLDLGFVGAMPASEFTDNSPLVMQIQGERADGSLLSTSIALPSPVSAGFRFFPMVLDAAFQASGFKQIYIYGLPCDTSGSCTGFASDKGQFAVDNLELRAVAAVPEPSAWALTSLGLLAMGGFMRRQRRSAD